MLVILSTQIQDFTLSSEIGRGDFGKVYLSNIPGSYQVAIKVFKKVKDSHIELRNAQDICGAKLKGLCGLEDYGMIDERNIAERLECAMNSVFIVYRHLDQNLNFFCGNPENTLSFQDTI